MGLILLSCDTTMGGRGGVTHCKSFAHSCQMLSSSNRKSSGSIASVMIMLYFSMLIKRNRLSYCVDLCHSSGFIVEGWGRGLWVGEGLVGGWGVSVMERDGGAGRVMGRDGGKGEWWILA